VQDEHNTRNNYFNDGDRAAWSIGLGVPVGPVRTRFDYARVSETDEPHYGAVASWDF
jgi:hypothetical protein